MTSVLTVLLVFFSANAQDWKGFKKVEGSNDIPHAELAMASVFKVQTFNAATEAKFEIVNVAKQKQVTNSKTLNTDFRALQIETCRRYGISKCPVSTRISTSTAVLNGGKKLQGCRHSFHNWMAMATKVNGLALKEIHIPMLITNYKGDVIYNSAYSPADHSVSVLNTDERLNVVYDNDVLFKTRPQFDSFIGLSDYISLTFSEIIADTTTFANGAEPSVNDRTYNFGYPAKTKYYGGVKKGDAPGDTLVATSGAVVLYDSVYNYIQTNNPSAPGMSGGAMLNSNGMLMGIVCRGDKDMADGLLNNEDYLVYGWEKIVSKIVLD